jgi:hypothetical protein
LQVPQVLVEWAARPAYRSPSFISSAEAPDICCFRCICCLCGFDFRTRTQRFSRQQSLVRTLQYCTPFTQPLLR